MESETDFKAGYLGCAEYMIKQITAGAQVLRNKLENEKAHAEIQLRQFSPVSGYEVDPKREEWRGIEDCQQCPHYQQTGKMWDVFFTHFSPIWDCRLRKDRFDRALDLGSNAFCRFPEYRHNQFRHFGPLYTIVRCPDCFGDGDISNIDPETDELWYEDCQLCDGQGVLFWAELVTRIGEAEAKELAELTQTYSRFEEEFASFDPSR